MSAKIMPDEMKQLLNDSGLPWHVENGARHFKLIIGGKLATVLPFSPSSARQNRRGHRNLIATVRRVIRQQIAK